MPVLFTPGQLMEALSLSKQQWRTYRKALPLLNVDGGRSRCLTAGDFLAAAIVQYVSDTSKMPVPAFGVVAEPLFSVCRSNAWPQLERSYISLMVADARVALIDTSHGHPPASLAILVQLKPLVLHVHRKILETGSDPQKELAFPPMVAGGRQ